MEHWETTDTREFDPEDTDANKIGRGIIVPCRICWTLFGRVRLTVRYCYECKEGFCEGEHGRFAERHGHYFCDRHHPAFSN
jgi:hypothetical protein